MKKKKIIFVNLIDEEQNIRNTLNNNHNIDIKIVCSDIVDSKLNLHNYDSLIISVKQNHQDLFHFYFDYFKNKPVLSVGYACIFLSKYYNCYELKNTYIHSPQCFIKLDKRFKIHSSIDEPYNRITLNNDNNRIIMPNDSSCKSTSYCVTDCYIETSYKFMYDSHYGVLFNLNDSLCGTTVLNNFIEKI